MSKKIKNLITGLVILCVLGAVFFHINYTLETIENNIILKPNDKVIISLGKEIYTILVDRCYL